MTADTRPGGVVFVRGNKCESCEVCWRDSEDTVCAYPALKGSPVLVLPLWIVCAECLRAALAQLGET